jgi:hypothetical protein
MELRGIVDLLPFLNFLRDLSKQHWYRLEHSSADTVTIEIHMPGVRLEVDFLQDEVWYSIFEGDESVQTDQAQLIALLKERGT